MSEKTQVVIAVDENEIQVPLAFGEQIQTMVRKIATEKVAQRIAAEWFANHGQEIARDLEKSLTKELFKKEAKDKLLRTVLDNMQSQIEHRLERAFGDYGY